MRHGVREIEVSLIKVQQWLEEKLDVVGRSPKKYPCSFQITLERRVQDNFRNVEGRRVAAKVKRRESRLTGVPRRV